MAVFGPFKAKLKTAFNDWHVNNPGKTLNIYNIPKLAKIAYFESFNCKNITSAFEKTGIWPFNKLAFSDEDFTPVQVYHSDSTAGPDVNVPQIIPEDIDLAQLDLPARSTPASPSLLSQPFHLPSTSAVGLITPEIIRPYPKVDRKALKKSKKGKLPGISRIYTDSPEKYRLEEIEKAKAMKKQEQERKQRVKEMKRALNLLSDTNITPKPKRQKKTVETDSEDETDISLRESSCSSIEEMSEGSDIENETPVMSEDIKEDSFVLVKFEKKKSVLHYVGQVVIKYNPTEYNVSFLRKKPSTWKFVFPDTKDEGTVSISDVVCILPQPKSAFTARTAKIFSFGKDLSVYNVQ